MTAGYTVQLHVPSSRTAMSRGLLRLSVVVPTYNEAENIEPFVRSMIELLETELPGDYELIIVDDDSPDLTWQIGVELSKSYPQVRVVRRVGERGLARAVLAGYAIARGKAVGTINADFQHPPEVVLKLLEKIEQGADIANASRYVDSGEIVGWSQDRKFLSLGARQLLKILLPKTAERLTDPLSGCYLVRKDILAKISPDPVGFKTLIEITARSKSARIAEVGFCFRERRAGRSKVTFKQYFNYLAQLINLSRYR